MIWELLLNEATEELVCELSEGNVAFTATEGWNTPAGSSDNPGATVRGPGGPVSVTIETVADLRMGKTYRLRERGTENSVAFFLPTQPPPRDGLVRYAGMVSGEVPEWLGERIGRR